MATIDRGSPEDRAWTRMDPVALVDHLEVTHHAWTHAQLPLLTELAEEVAEQRGGDGRRDLYDVQAQIGELRGDLEAHLAREEAELFPAIRHAARVRWDLASTALLERLIDELWGEHEATLDALSALRALTGDHEVPQGPSASHRALVAGLAELDADLRLHVHKEQDVLFPAVRRRLGLAT